MRDDTGAELSACRRPHLEENGQLPVHEPPIEPEWAHPAVWKDPNVPRAGRSRGREAIRAERRARIVVPVRVDVEDVVGAYCEGVGPRECVRYVRIGDPLRA